MNKICFRCNLISTELLNEHRTLMGKNILLNRVIVRGISLESFMHSSRVPLSVEIKKKFKKKKRIIVLSICKRPRIIYAFTVYRKHKMCNCTVQSYSDIAHRHVNLHPRFQIKASVCSFSGLFFFFHFISFYVSCFNFI